MPSPHIEEKKRIIQEVWLPVAIFGGEELYPRRSQKRMKLFTLTDSNCIEIVAFEKEKLIQRAVVAWQQHDHEVWRLESELKKGSKVLYEGFFEEVLLEDPEVVEDMPFDILNLDYTSQAPELHTISRIEREINGGQKLVELQKNNDSKGFVLLYTTILDEVELDTKYLSFEFNLPLGLSNPAISTEQKIEYLRNSIPAIVESNDYHIVESSEILIDLEDNINIFSIGLASMR